MKEVNAYRTILCTFKQVGIKMFKRLKIVMN